MRLTYICCRGYVLCRIILFLKKRKNKDGFCE
nr:MAG TPA: hypothetical protein [Bacteriophage sp.]